MKEAVLKWMVDNNVENLPEPWIIEECCMLRDFSRWEPNPDDSKEEKAEKAMQMAFAIDLFDMYTDKMVANVAGPVLYSHHIRHTEPMTTSALPRKPGAPVQLRIPANTEAMAVLIYRNNWVKWNATHGFKKKFPGTNLPRYSSKRPNMKLPFKEKYTSTGNTVAHKKHPEWGGWSEEGRKKFVQLQAKVMASRRDNFDRHVEADEECIRRLYRKYPNLHQNEDRPNKKQKPVQDDDDEDDVDLQYIFEM